MGTTGRMTKGRALALVALLAAGVGIASSCLDPLYGDAGCYTDAPCPLPNVDAGQDAGQDAGEDAGDDAGEVDAGQSTDASVTPDASVSCSVPASSPSFQNPVALGGDINTAELQEAPTAAGTTLCFQSTSEGPLRIYCGFGDGGFFPMLALENVLDGGLQSVADPALSLDGKTLYFTRLPGGGTPPPTVLFRATFDGSEFVLPVEVPVALPDGSFAAGNSVSPDGAELYFSVSVTGATGPVSLYVSKADGSNPRALGLTAMDEGGGALGLYQPSVSSDGRYLVFSGELGGYSRLFMSRTACDGGWLPPEVIPVSVPNCATPKRPSFGPDDEVYFDCYIEGLNSELFVMHPQ